MASRRTLEVRTGDIRSRTGLRHLADAIGSAFRRPCAPPSSTAPSRVRAERAARFRPDLRALIGVACLLLTGIAAGQPDSRDERPDAPFSTPPALVEPSARERLAAQIELVEADLALDDAVREALLAELTETRVLLERAAVRRSRIESFELEAAMRESTLAELASEFSAPVTEVRRPGPGRGRRRARREPRRTSTTR